MKHKLILKTSLGCLFAFTAVAAETEINKEYYMLPDDAKCKNNYCVDVDNAPITGVLRRYKDGFLVREYITKDGYLDGISKAFYKNGRIKSERSYKQGKLNGNVTQYDEEGELIENIAYKDGKKEGISSYYNQNNIIKIIYINDNITGDAQIWDKTDSQLIYKLKMQDNKVIEGTYFYKHNGNIRELELPPIIIDGQNNQCIKLQGNLSPTSCAVNIKTLIPQLSNKEELLTECNQDWFTQHRNELIKYTKKCKCNDLKAEIKRIYEDKEQNPKEKKELLLNLKEKYENHCMESNE